LENQKKEKKQRKSYLFFSSVSFQMIFIIIIGFYIGDFFDFIFNSYESLYKIIFSFFAIIISIYFFYKKI